MRVSSKLSNRREKCNITDDDFFKEKPHFFSQRVRILEVTLVSLYGHLVYSSAHAKTSEKREQTLLAKTLGYVCFPLAIRFARGVVSTFVDLVR